MKNRKITIFLIFILTFIITISIGTIAQKSTETTFSIITHNNLNIQTSKSIEPYSYYRIYLYVSEEDDWEANTFYYHFLENADSPFFGKKIYIEDEKLDSSIFERYNVLAFAKKNDYSFTLDNYKLDNSNLEITLNEDAICENFFISPTGYAFGGIILIPKEEQLDSISVFLNKKDENDNYIIHKKSCNEPINHKNYSKKLIDEQTINNSNLIPLNDFYIKLITTEEELLKTCKELELINDIDFLNSTSYSNFFLYRNVLLCICNSNGEFYCEPQIDKDFYYQDVWSPNSLNLKEYFYNTSKENYIAYCSLIPLPKVVSIENISVIKKELNYKNFEDNDMKINLEHAEKIAQNHFNTTASLLSNSSLEIVNLNTIKNFPSKNDFENPCYRRMWLFRDEHFNKIYIDATTGEILL